MIQKKDNKGNKWVKRTIVTSVIIITLIIILKYAGSYLVFASPLEKADTVLLFLGGSQDKEVAKFVKLNYAQTITLTTLKNQEKPEVELNNKTIYSSAAFAIIQMRNDGIADSSIVVLDTKSVNTADEAHAFVEYLKENPSIKSCIVVSGTFHMRRIRLILNHFCKKENVKVKFIYQPVCFEKHNPEKWWQKSQNRQFVILEYLKTVNFLLFDKQRFY